MLQAKDMGFSGLHQILHISTLVLQLQMIKAIVNSHRFKGSSSDEPRRVQVLDLYCLTMFESKSLGREDVY